ncbi:unnamed protein product [Alopecurus aequalis]
MANPIPPAWMAAAARKWLEDAGDIGKDVGGAGAVDGSRAFNALPLSGVCVSLAERGRALCSLRVPAQLTDAEGNWHAGAIAAAVDDVCAAAIMSVEGIIKVSVHYDISYFAPAKHHKLQSFSLSAAFSLLARASTFYKPEVIKLDFLKLQSFRLSAAFSLLARSSTYQT